MGLVVAVLTGLVILGGIGRIGRVSETLVPCMALLFIGGGVMVLICHRAAIPEALEAITMKAMAPNPDNRYPSADAMLADLEEFRKNPSINFDYDVSEFVPEEPEESAMTQIRTPHTPVRSRVPEPEPRSAATRSRRGRGGAGEPSQAPGPPAGRDKLAHHRGHRCHPGLCGGTVLLHVSVLHLLHPDASPDYTIPKLTGYTYEEVLQDRS